MGKARRTAEVIGAEGFWRRPPQMPVHPALLAELYLPEICQGPIRDCGRMTGKPEVIRRRTLDRIGGFRPARREVVQTSASRRGDLPEARLWTVSGLPTNHELGLIPL